jgi:diguanylate cyclase (GGDEF)-like protein
MRRERDETVTDREQRSSSRETVPDRDSRSATDDWHAAEAGVAAGADAGADERARLTPVPSDRDSGGAGAGFGDETTPVGRPTAEERDRAAEARDRGAAGRDRLAHLHDLEDDAGASREAILRRAERDRARAAADRAKAADDRARAAADREDAARDRAEALRAQTESERDLRLAATDELTGAWTRKFGLEEVSRELERAHRTGNKLALAFLDVDGLKEINDRRGHVAGDELLSFLGETLRANVRPYDVIVRYGGDELVCAMPGMSTSEARARFETIAASLEAADADYSVTYGLAEAEPADGLQDLIARADAELLEARRAQTSDN